MESKELSFVHNPQLPVPDRGMALSTALESPLTALVKSLLHPLLATVSLLVCVLAYGEHFTGYYLVLAVLTFFIASQVFDEVDILVPWSSFHLTRLIRGVVVGWGIVAAILLFLGYATQLTKNFDYNVILTWFAVTPLTLLVGTKLARTLVRRAVTNGSIARSAVVIGANQLGCEIVARFRRDLYSGTSVRGYFDDRRPTRLTGLDRSELLGKVSEAAEYVKRNNIDCVYIALPIAAQPRIIELINALRDSTASVYFAPHLFVFDLIQARVDSINGIPVVAVCETPLFGVNAVVKRAFDIVMATLILLLIWPLMALVAIGVRISSPGPALFKQRRYGLGGEEIMVYKFRTMRVMEDGDANYTQVTKEDARVTGFGRFLRRTSIDELPQFVNVLQGRMSIVGPRPHAVAVNEQYRKLIRGYMIRHKVKPGITGWAQVNGYRGGDDLGQMQKRIEYDLDYLRNWSVSLDMWIMVKTVITVWKDRNAY